MKTYNSKTIEELDDIYEIAHAKSLVKSSAKGDHLGIWEVTAHLAGLEAIAEACTPKWISVKQENHYPKKGEIVNLWTGVGRPFEGFYDYENKMFCENNPYKTFRPSVTHYMPLPESPK